MISKIKAILLVLVASLDISLATLGYGQAPKGRREAYGVERADQVEILLHTLFPKAQVEWDPVLVIREGPGPATPVDVGNFVATRQSDGSINGVTALEVGTAKADYIEQVMKLKSSDEVFTTTIVAFRAAPSGQPVETKKVSIDPDEPLTKITWFEVRSWPAGGWPVLRLFYQSYTPGRDSLTVLEWDSLFDMATGSFVGRIPNGVWTLRKGGDGIEEIFSSRRTSPTEIEIRGSSNKVINYPCGDPCVVDGRTFLALWSQ